MQTRDLTAALLPKLEDVERAIESNTRERKRLFLLRRLVAGSTGDQAPAKDEPTRPDPGPARK